MTITIHTPINTRPLTESLSEALAEVIYSLYSAESNAIKKEDEPDEDSDLQQKIEIHRKR